MISIPFSGNKRFAYKYVKPIVEGRYKKVFEPFGGSCVLSVNLYNDGIVDEVFINDYDRYFDSYEEYLDYKDWIVESCWDKGFYKVVDNTEFSKLPVSEREEGLKRGIKKYKHVDREGNVVGYSNSYKMPDEFCEYLQSLVAQVPKRLWDKYLTSGSNFVFNGMSHRKVYLKDFKYFKRDLSTTTQRKYLEIIKKLGTTNLEYHDYFDCYKDKIDSNSIIILDPPYVDDFNDVYAEDFDVKKTIELLKIVDSFKTDFIFFNNDEQLMRLLFEYCGIKDYEIRYTNKFYNNATLIQRKDFMIYKRYS